jgi:hypothetical protein
MKQVLYMCKQTKITPFRLNGSAEHSQEGQKYGKGREF